MAIRVCKFCGDRVQHTEIFKQKFIDDNGKQVLLNVCSKCKDILEQIPDARICYVCKQPHSKSQMTYREKSSGFDGAYYCSGCANIAINDAYELQYKNQLKDLIVNECKRHGIAVQDLFFIQLENIKKRDNFSWFQLYCIAYWLVSNTKIQLPRVIYRLGDWVQDASQEFTKRQQQMESIKKALELKAKGELYKEVKRYQRVKTEEEKQQEYEEKMRRIGISSYQPDVPEEVYINRTEEKKQQDKEQNDYIKQQLMNMFGGRR